jgi:2'-5' RNA ligase
VRLFLAIPVPEEAKRALTAAQRQVESGAPGFFRWTREDQIHLTLYFLGEMESEQPVIEAVGQVAQPKFELEIQGLVVLPEPHVPRILAAGTAGDVQPLRSLQRKLADTVFPIAAFKETRGFSPHVTFGRLKQGMPGNAKALKRTLAALDPPKSDRFTVGNFELVQSRTEQQGATYETLHRFLLG